MSESAPQSKAGPAVGLQSHASADPLILTAVIAHLFDLMRIGGIKILEKDLDAAAKRMVTVGVRTLPSGHRVLVVEFPDPEVEAQILQAAGRIAPQPARMM